jgi:DNA polymerase
VPDATDTVRFWIDWYEAMGVTDAVGDRPRRFYDDGQSPATAAARVPLPPPPSRRTTPATADQPVEDARRIAGDCRTLDELIAALAAFEGCRLRDTCMNLCVADGNPQARIMLIGEAPGAEEDRQGRPFCGPSGQLLDRMLATIGLTRNDVYITNLVFWRPPGNRAPTAAEIAICQPFLERQIELLRPALLQFVGGLSARALLGLKDGVTRLRGRPYSYESGELGPIPALVMFHPAYLLRQPAQKRLAWRDLLTMNETIGALGLR